MSFDKSKFVSREGDAEGFTPAILASASPLRYASDMFAARIESHGTTVTLPNPKGWQEVDGVELPSVYTWAQPSRLDEVADEVLEAAFQEWLRNSTKPQLLAAYRARLRQRINDMVEKAQQPVDNVTDLREVR